MERWVTKWVGQLRIQHKVWIALLLLCVPLGAGIALHLYVIQQLLVLQQHRQELMLADEQVHMLGRLAIDIEDGFRGYALTQQPAFLAPLVEAEAKLDRVLSDAAQSLATLSDGPDHLGPIARQLKALLRSKHELIEDSQKGSADKMLAYVRSGEGLRLSDLLREELRDVEDRLKRRRDALNRQGDALSQRTFYGLWITLAGVVALGWIVSRSLARSLTDPITRLQSATARIGAQVDVAEITELLAAGRGAKDELGQLAEAYLAMARRIERNIKEIEALGTIGHEVSTIGPDHLDSVLRRVTDRAVELVQTDICVVLLRDDRVSCWIVEAASGEWNDRLVKSVVPWQELPVSVQAFETREAAMGERRRSDERPRGGWHDLIGESVLAIPLVVEGTSIGVLLFLNGQSRAVHEWNQRLAEGLAQEVALAISHARSYQAAQQKQRDLVIRLRQLEHLAETLAHDLKGPGARMEELARLLVQQDRGQFDDRTKRWLSLLEQNGRDLVQRVEGILTVAHVGAEQEVVTAVGPNAIISEVLNARAGEIERLCARVYVEPGLPLIACSGAYLRQIFDNLISNALKFARPDEPPVVKIRGHAQGSMVMFTVEDHGIGIPAPQRDRVFQPFVRLLISEAPGSGIGLTIVQRIVELSGGKVWIEGGDRTGCTIHFTMPTFQEQRGGIRAGLHPSTVPETAGVVRREAL